MAAKGPLVGVREVRKAYGLTIPVLVERIAQNGVQVTADHISNVELGYRRASRALMAAWCDALDLNPLDVSQPHATPAAPVKAAV